MLIHDQTANHQLCWNGPVAIRLAKHAPTSVSNPLVALDILKNHWAEEDKSADYNAAVDACLAATQGRGGLEQARDAFIRATKTLSTNNAGNSMDSEQAHAAQSAMPSSRSPSEHVAQAQQQQPPQR